MDTLSGCLSVRVPAEPSKPFKNSKTFTQIFKIFFTLILEHFSLGNHLESSLERRSTSKVHCITFSFPSQTIPLAITAKETFWKLTIEIFMKTNEVIYENLELDINLALLPA